MFTKSFTDPQGQTFEAAVFMVRQAALSTNQNSTLQSGENGYKDASMSDQVSDSLSYQMLYFTSQESLDAGNDPYPLFNVETPSGMMGDEKLWFRANDLDETYSGLSAAGAAEKHCQEVALA